MYNFSIFFKPHLNNFIALFLASHNDRIFLAEDVVTTVDKHTEFEISFVLVGYVEVYNFISEGFGDRVKASVVEGQSRAHHDAFGVISDIYFEGDDVRAEGEKLV